MSRFAKLIDTMANCAALSRAIYRWSADELEAGNLSGIQHQQIRELFEHCSRLNDELCDARLDTQMDALESKRIANETTDGKLDARQASLERIWLEVNALVDAGQDTASGFVQRRALMTVLGIIRREQEA